MAAVVEFLVDTSAIARYSRAEVAAKLDQLLVAGLLATCALVDLQLLYTARDQQQYARLAAVHRMSFISLDTADVDLRRAVQLQATLAEHGQHRIAWPDLIIAAVAERHQVTLLHYHPGYDLITAITGQPAQWVVPKGSLTEES